VNGEKEDASLVGALGRPHDGRLPVEEVVADGAGAALRGRVATEVLKFLKEPGWFWFCLTLKIIDAGLGREVKWFASLGTI
jgi:hypothetical protein